MLRGVNKNIIEIVETDNQFFEKAILFVRPQAKEQSTDILKVKAMEYLSAVRSTPAQTCSVQTKAKPVASGLWVKIGVGLAILAVAALVVFL